MSGLVEVLDASDACVEDGGVASGDGEVAPVDDAEAKRRQKKKDARARQKAKKQATKRDVLRIAETSALDNLAPPAKLEAWFAAYSGAFAEEHDWMEARKQSTSRALGLDAARMLLLVFRAEQGSGMERACFFAYSGGDASPCGYATVDVDPDPARVCHLRMLMIAPEQQRRGVGAALLKHVVDHFAERELGLKYVRLGRQCAPRRAAYESSRTPQNPQVLQKPRLPQALQHGGLQAYRRRRALHLHGAQARRGWRAQGDRSRRIQFTSRCRGVRTLLSHA